MCLEEFSMMLTAFREAFGLEAERPGWSECRLFTLDVMLAAIRIVRANPKTKFYARDLIAGLVIRAATPKSGGHGKRSKRQEPVFPRRA